jgi:DNA transformation protein
MAMPASQGFCDLVLEALSPLGPIRIKRMFGGAGVWHGDTMFAIIADDTLYLKANDGSRSAFEAEGMARFAYTGKSRTIEMSYWRAPERLLDEHEEMREWAAKAIEAARTGQSRKSEARSPKSPPNARGKSKHPRRKARI